MKLVHFALCITMFALSPALAVDDGRWADSPKKQWFESLEIPDAARQRMGIVYKSCCDRGDLVKTKFRVGMRGDDVWEYLDDTDGGWKVVPADIILDQPGIDGEPRMFKRLMTGEPLCFVKPNGGI